MVHQLFDRGAVLGILLEASIEEIASFGAEHDVGGDFDIVLNDFDQLFLLGDPEGVLPDQHLVHHDPNRPNIDLLVVLVSLQDLRTNVERRSAKSCTHFVVLVH
jgi:hypothetical protein